MHRTLRLWVVSISVAALTLLCAVSWVSYRSTKELIAANERRARAHKVIEGLTALHLFLDDAESASRGYALSGGREYLQPYKDSLAQVQTTVQILRHDLSFSPDQLKSVEELEPLIRSRRTCSCVV